jgi:amidase
VGRAWDDEKVLGFGYALEQQLGGAGHLVPATAPRLQYVAEATAPVGGMVPATLSLSLGAAASFGAFTPGIAKDYTASTTASVISTAGDAALNVSPAPAYLANGTFALPSPLEVSFSKATWTAPVSNDPVTIAFKQHIGATDALRTGAYSKTLTFTLSTTTP